MMEKVNKREIRNSRYFDDDKNVSSFPSSKGKIGRRNYEDRVTFSEFLKNDFFNLNTPKVPIHSPRYRSKAFLTQWADEDHVQWDEIEEDLKQSLPALSWREFTNSNSNPKVETCVDQIIPDTTLQRPKTVAGIYQPLLDENGTTSRIVPLVKRKVKSNVRFTNNNKELNNSSTQLGSRPTSTILINCYDSYEPHILLPTSKCKTSYSNSTKGIRTSGKNRPKSAPEQVGRPISRLSTHRNGEGQSNELLTSSSVVKWAGTMLDNSMVALTPVPSVSRSSSSMNILRPRSSLRRSTTPRSSNVSRNSCDTPVPTKWNQNSSIWNSYTKMNSKDCDNVVENLTVKKLNISFVNKEDISRKLGINWKAVGNCRCVESPLTNNGSIVISPDEAVSSMKSTSSNFYRINELELRALRVMAQAQIYMKRQQDCMESERKRVEDEIDFQKQTENERINHIEKMMEAKMESSVKNLTSKTLAERQKYMSTLCEIEAQHERKEIALRDQLEKALTSFSKYRDNVQNRFEIELASRVANREYEIRESMMLEEESCSQKPTTHMRKKFVSAEPEQQPIKKGSESDEKVHMKLRNLQKSYAALQNDFKRLGSSKAELKMAFSECIKKNAELIEVIHSLNGGVEMENIQNMIVPEFKDCLDMETYTETKAIIPDDQPAFSEPISSTLDVEDDWFMDDDPSSNEVEVDQSVNKLHESTKLLMAMIGRSARAVTHS